MSVPVALKHLFRDALNAFVDCNDGILPETIVVYRASVNQEEWPLVDAIEMQALVQVVKRDAGASCRCEGLACHPVLYPVYQRSVPADTRSR